MESTKFVALTLRALAIYTAIFSLGVAFMGLEDTIKAVWVFVTLSAVIDIIRKRGAAYAVFKRLMVVASRFKR